MYIIVNSVYTCITLVNSNNMVPIRFKDCFANHKRIDSRNHQPLNTVHLSILNISTRRGLHIVPTRRCENKPSVLQIILTALTPVICKTNTTIDFLQIFETLPIHPSLSAMGRF